MRTTCKLQIRRQQATPRWTVVASMAISFIAVSLADTMETDQSNEQTENKRSNRFWILLGILNALLIVIVVVVATTLPNSKNEEDQQMDVAMTPSTSPTYKEWEEPTDNDGPPVKPSTYEEYQSDLLSALRRQNSYLSSFPDENSALTKALEWMIHEDENFEIGRTQPDILLERFILAVFYYTTGGPTWYYDWEDGPNYLSTIFLSNTSVCDWRGLDGLDDQGVFCDNDSRVVGIEVNYGINGTIPTELALLQKLETLNLCNGKLEGSIPTELGLVTSLTSLQLCVNELRGVIPIQLAGLSNLRSINLGVNHLSGKLPSEIGNLQQLVWLQLYANDLSGEIPSEIQTMRSLRDIDLSENQRLSGTLPSEIGLLSNLEEINFDECDLTGGIPSEVGFLGSLETLALAKNNFTGSIPSQIGSLSNLRRMFLGFNKFTGGLPVELGQLLNLAYVELQDNFLTGSVPDEVCGLRGGTLERLIMDCSIGADNVTSEVQCAEPECCSECQ